MNKQERFRELMRLVFDEMRGGVQDELGLEEYERMREAFAFHMSDWIEQDVDELTRLRDSREVPDVQEAAKAISGALYHLIPHLTEAGNLLLDGVSNPFAENALKKEKDVVAR